MGTRRKRFNKTWFQSSIKCQSRIFSITCLIGVDWRKWRTRIGHSNGLEIPNLSRHDYKEKIRRFWIQDSGVLKRKRSGIGNDKKLKKEVIQDRKEPNNAGFEREIGGLRIPTNGENN